MAEKITPPPELFALLAEKKSLLTRLGLGGVCPSKWERSTGKDLLGDAFDFSVKATSKGGLAISWTRRDAAGEEKKSGWSVTIGAGAGGKMKVLSAVGTPIEVKTIKDAGALVRDALKKSAPTAAASNKRSRKK